MKVARIAVLGVALSAGGAAALLVGGQKAPAPAPIAAAPAPVQTVDVLVAAADLPIGHTLKAADLRWQPWPANAPASGAIKRQDAPSGLDELAGAIVRSGFLNGEPIRREKLIKANGSGFMSAILPSGMRAVAISIDNRGSTSAGGFILPNDRVDVIHTYTGSNGSGTVSEIVLSNIRVLAIGQNVQERNGEKVVTGETATLELTPAQAETIVLAQRVGQLSLALRSLADRNQAENVAREQRAGGLTIIRYGVSQQAPRQ